MPKKTQKRNRRVKRKTLKAKSSIKKSMKRTNKSSIKKGGENEKVTCCMCEREVDKSNTLVPRACLIDHGRAAHRICHTCWWNPESGFALENRADHKCPGCLKNLPLTAVENNDPGVIDLTLDDE